MFGSNKSNPANNQSQLTRIEQKLDAILNHLDIRYRADANEYDSSGYSNLSPEVIKQLRQGKTISAIKEYRIETGVGLREAKEVIDQAIEQGLF